jgi:hypothetical protein
MRNAIAIVLWLGGITGCGTPKPEPSLLPSPSPLGGGAEPEPASLIRRLAEAADGFRDGRDKYVVADRHFPHNVLLVSDSLDQAQDSLSRSDVPAGSDYRVYGPFRTPADTDYVTRDEIDSVVVWTASGEHKSYKGKEYDALFWGVTAFDKFVTPYLTVVYGATYAAEQRRRYLSGVSPLVHSTAVSHYRSSF